MKKSKLLLGIMSLLCLVGCGRGYSKIDINNLPVRYDDVRASYFRKTVSPDVPSIGDVKGLVLPVDFRDKPCSALTNHGGCDGVKKDIQTTLFGDGSGTNWESLASYYNKSSYGKLNITGEVADWYTASVTAANLGSTYNPNDGASGGSIKILDEALANYKKTHDAEHMKQFDSNGDGHLDAVWVIYSVEAQWNSFNDLYWAFVFWNQGSAANVDNPTSYSYMWASYDFLYENAETTEDGTVLPDAHTFIHETGHLLGLSDYYNYDTDDHNKWGPIGGLDMMDYNIGDHNSYSKTLLEWVEPYVVNKSTTITLKPFESSGDCVIVPHKDYKGSILDEYLIIEYYTPTGLNTYDSVHPYAGYYPLLFSEAGVKVYHVDSRIGGFRESSSSYVFAKYIETMDEAFRFQYVDVVAENSPSRSDNPDPDQKLIQLLESSGNNTFITGARANNETLFQVGDTFGLANGPFAGFTYHKTEAGENLALQFGFEIKSMSEKGVTISFKKL